jgi:circadian clock protein KaiC
VQREAVTMAAEIIAGRSKPTHRIATRIAGLDLALHGGLVQGGMYLLLGAPGTGKTTLANQIAFGHAATGGRTVYLTLLAESHAHMLTNLEELEFFDPKRVGTGVCYLGGYLALRDRKLPGLLELLHRVLVDRLPDFLIVDGMSATHAQQPTEIALKEFVAELQALASMAGCTTLLLSSGETSMGYGPERTMVDGILELTLDIVRHRPVRELRVLKLRSSDHWIGPHAITLDRRGISVTPCTEQRYVRSGDIRPSDGETIETGIAGLDSMLSGGLASASVTLLTGSAGTGKTLFGLHMLARSAQRALPGLYVGFYEAPSELLRDADAAGIRLRDALGSGIVEMHWQVPSRHALDVLADRILDDVSRRAVRCVVIDGIGGLRQACTDAERLPRFFVAFANELRARGVATIVTDEDRRSRASDAGLQRDDLSALVDNILVLEHVVVDTARRRLVSVVKQRGAAHDPEPREVFLGTDGISVADSAESAAAIVRARRSFRRGVGTDAG